MSYSCPECRNVIYDRTNYTCPMCGSELPAVLLFRPPDMPDFDKVAEGKGIQVALLAELLRDLRRAGGHSQAIHEATIRYFKEGIAKGFDPRSLFEWLFSWPNDRWSVVSQAPFPGRSRQEFFEMLTNGIKDAARRQEGL